MVKRIEVITVIILLIFLVGCGAFSRGSSGTIQVPEVHKGKDGLTIKFIDNAPPLSVFEDTNFPILIELQNKGATDINYGWYTLGVEQANMDLLGDPVKPFSLLGRTASDKYGEQKIVELLGHAKKLPSQTQRMDSVISVTGCYSYGTDASADVCIDTDLFGLARYEKSCKIKNIAMSGGQGGPVSVSKIEVQMLPHDEQNKVIPQFIIYVQNMGEGQPIVPEAVDTACSSRSIKSEQYNVVKVEASLFEYELDCKPKLSDIMNDETLQQQNPKAGYKKLEKKEGIIKCELPDGLDKARGTYTSPLTVHLDYGYTDTISKKVEIKKV